MLVGAAVGLLHAGYVYRRVATEGPRSLDAHPFVTHALAGYYALWTLGLWVLFGTYVVVLWLISVVFYAIHKVFR